ncbi:unnamed protein product, partial [Arabidopsis halleri]
MVYGDDHGNKTLFDDKEGSYENKSGVITMLRFKTNNQTFPDIGVGTTSSFVLHKVDNKIVGFHEK